MSSTLTVDLKKIRDNLTSIKAITGHKVQIMSVVKDNAYGHGLIKVADFLKDESDWFCVANLEEALELREHQIQNPILVFGVPENGKGPLYKEYNITAAISDLGIFERLESGTNCHLQFDTGMQRLGLNINEVDQVLEKIQKYSGLNYSGIFTHFADADEPGNPRVVEQLKAFNSIRARFPSDWMAHAANTGGIFHYHREGVLLNGVRPGISLYGFPSGETNIPGIKPVSKWTTQIVQIRKISEGDKVGYGSKWEAPENGFLAVLPVGYADGVSRSLSGQILVEIQGVKYLQVGTVSMDYIMVFLGKDKYSVGEDVTILGEGELSAKKWADKIGTIPYEILTGIAPKVKRFYVS